MIHRGSRAHHAPPPTMNDDENNDAAQAAMEEQVTDEAKFDRTMYCYSSEVSSDVSSDENHASEHKAADERKKNERGRDMAACFNNPYGKNEKRVIRHNENEKKRLQKTNKRKNQQMQKRPKEKTMISNMVSMELGTNDECIRACKAVNYRDINEAIEWILQHKKSMKETQEKGYRKSIYTVNAEKENSRGSQRQAPLYQPHYQPQQQQPVATEPHQQPFRQQRQRQWAHHGDSHILETTHHLNKAEREKSQEKLEKLNNEKTQNNNKKKEWEKEKKEIEDKLLLVTVQRDNAKISLREWKKISKANLESAASKIKAVNKESAALKDVIKKRERERDHYYNKNEESLAIAHCNSDCF